MVEQVEKVVVIGAGTMGHGIAQVCASCGCEVALHDAAIETVPRALDRIAGNLAGGVQRGKLTEAERGATLGRLRAAHDLDAEVADSDLIVEAIVEDIAVKRSLFARLAGHASEAAILASNTSSLSIASIAKGIPHPERVVGMHFFNPVHIMKLVEVVVHAGTAAGIRDRVVELARAMGKDPIVVRDSPGFASSRLGGVLGLEAMRMVEQEVASAEDIDKAMQLGYGHPMGPLKLTDLVGLDVRLAIAEFLHGELRGDQYRPPEILRRKVEAGELGKKSGQGFYDWSD